MDISKFQSVTVLPFFDKIALISQILIVITSNHLWCEFEQDSKSLELFLSPTTIFQ